MTLFAKLITSATIREITELNGGVQPFPSTMDNHTFYVYGEYHSDVRPQILPRSEFEKKFRWQNVNSDDNVVVKR